MGANKTGKAAKDNDIRPNAPPLGTPSFVDMSTVAENADFAARAGADFVELNLDLPYAAPGRNKPEDLRSLTEQTGVGFTLHYHEDADFATLNRDLGEFQAIQFEKTIKWAEAAGISLINVHLNPGIYFTLPEKKVWLYERYRNEFLANVRAVFTRFALIAAPRGVKISVENTSAIKHDHIKAAVKELARIDGIWFTLDAGHDARFGGGAETLFPKSKIAHFHLHDYNGESDHLELFTGRVDIARLLSLARELGARAVVETKTPAALESSFAALRQKGLR